LPNLTTIIQPIEQMAETAVYMLTARTQDPDAGEDTVLPVKVWSGKTV